MSAKKGLLGWLSAFVGFDMVVLGGLLIPQLRTSVVEPQMVTGALTSLLTPPLLLLLSALMSPDFKASLTFWRTRYALPGHRAFSLYVHGDARIDVAALERRIGPFPSSPVAQNAEWYLIYRLHRNDDAVLDANRRFLLFRDLATVSVLLAVGVPIALKLAGWEIAMAPAGAVFAVQYVLSSIAAQQAGIRFVRTVLAIESTS
jgi:hypothetical protein